MVFEKRIIFALVILFSINFVLAWNFPSTQTGGGTSTVTVVTLTGNLTNLSQMADVNIPSPSDGEFLTYDTATSKWIADIASAGAENDPKAYNGTLAYNQTLTDMWIAFLNTTNLTYHSYNSTGLIKDWNASSWIIDWNGTGYLRDWSYLSSIDTNETPRFDNLTSYDCPSGFIVQGVQNNGTVLCIADSTGGNTTTEIRNAVNNSGYYNISTNDSRYWDNLDTYNSTQFTENAGKLELLLSWFTTMFNSVFGGKTTDDLTQGSTNLYDNKSWNETYADTQYAAFGITGDNTSWNQTYAGTLFPPIANWTNLTNADCSATDKVMGVQLNGTVLCALDIATNTTYLRIDQWNSTNTTYLRVDQWNSTNSTYRQMYNESWVGNQNVTGNTNFTIGFIRDGATNCPTTLSGAICRNTTGVFIVG